MLCGRVTREEASKEQPSEVLSRSPCADRVLVVYRDPEPDRSTSEWSARICEKEAEATVVVRVRQPLAPALPLRQTGDQKHTLADLYAKSLMFISSKLLFPNHNAQIAQGRACRGTQERAL